MPGAEPDEQRLVNRQAGDALLRAPAGTRIPVDVEVVAGERDVALLEERNRVDEEAGDLAGMRADGGSSLPASDVEQDDVAGSGLDAGSSSPTLRDRRA